MSLLVRVQKSLSVTLRRNIGFTAIVANQKMGTDPIQNLFLQSIREYDQKSRAAGGKLVDPSPETEKDLKAELERVQKMYGGDGKTDMTAFPTFKFTEPSIESPVAAKEK